MGKDSSEIRREIDATRARMGDTVEALGYKADVPARVKDAVSDRVETVKGSIGGAVGGVMDGMQNATQRVGEAFGGAQRSVTAGMHDGTDRVGDAANRLTHSLPDAGDVRAAARRGAGIAAENPLGLAIGAAAVGFLAGLLVPVTDYERSTIGPIRDDLLERAQSVGSEALEHGKQVLTETAQAAFQTAQQSVQKHAQQVADEATGTAGHEMAGTRTSEFGALLDD